MPKYENTFLRAFKQALYESVWSIDTITVGNKLAVSSAAVADTLGCQRIIIENNGFERTAGICFCIMKCALRA